MKIKFTSQKTGYRLVLLSFFILFLSIVVVGQKPPNINANNNGQKEKFVSDEIIVQFKPEFAKPIQEAAKNRASSTGLKNIDNLNRKYGVNQIAKAFKFDDSPKTHKLLAENYGLTRTFILKISKGTNIEEALKEFNSQEEVEYAEQNFMAHGDVVPNDPIYSQQWGLNNTGQAIPYSTGVPVPVGTVGVDIKAQSAWDLHTGSNSTVLSILDTGVDYNHPEFAGRIVSGYDFINDDSNPMDDEGHGTACAGIAAASGNNGIGVAGVNWNCLIMPVKVLGSTGSGSYLAIANGITWAADNGADVLSLSLGGGGNSATLQNAVNYAHSLGCVIIASRGNNNNTALSYPASFANVIAVGALSPCNERKSTTSCDGEYWWGSSYGADLSVMAPGTRIHTTDRLGSVGYSAGDYNSTFNGTSAACPFVAGTVALIRSYKPSLSNEDIRDILQTTAADIGTPGFDNETGYGRVNAFAAMNAASAFVPAEILVSPITVSITIDPDAIGTENIDISNVAGIGGGNLNWNITFDSQANPWLSSNSMSGKIAVGGIKSVQLTANSLGMINGNYQCTLNINSNDLNSPLIQVAVNLTVNYLPPPVASITPLYLTYTVNTGETISELIHISNDAVPGNLNLHWSAVFQGNIPGISINPASGIYAPGASGSFALSINTAGVSGGIYLGSIDISTNDPDHILVSIPVNLTVNEPVILGQKLYVINSGGSNGPPSILRMELDGSNPAQMYSNHSRPINGALDIGNRKMYWIDWSLDAIFKGNLSGTGKTTFMTPIATLTSLALDVPNTHIYWMEQSPNIGIRRADLDGNNITNLINLPGQYWVNDLILDTQNNKMYWTNQGVWRANLDGTNPVHLITTTSSSNNMDIDFQNGKVYWTETYPSIIIKRADLADGGNPETLFTNPPNIISFKSIKLDNTNNKLYWSGFNQIGDYPNIVTTGHVYRANTVPGSATELVYTDASLDYPSILLDLSPAVINKPPVAVCKNITIPADNNCMGNAEASDFDGGSSDPELEPLTFTVSPAGPYPLGITNVILTVGDGLLTSTCNASVTVIDETVPVAPTPPADLFLQCDSDVPPPVSLTATDNCGDITVSPTTQVTPGVCLNDFTIVRTWTFTDASGNTNSVSQTITVKDDTAPELQSALPAVLNLQCAGEVPHPVDLTATDNCNGNITVSPTIQIIPGANVNSFTEIRTWTFTDACNNTSSVSETIKVNDTTPPEIICPAYIVITNTAGSCDTPVVLGTPTVNDNCGILSVTNDAPLSGFPFGDTNVTWTVTDLSNNKATCIQKVTINKIQTTSSITVTPGTQQYSDVVRFDATLSPGSCSDAGQAAQSVTFMVGSQVIGTVNLILNTATNILKATLTAPLVETPSNPSNGQMAPGGHTVIAVFNGINSNFIVSNPTTNLVVKQEDVLVEYVGSEFQATQSSTSSIATVVLRAVLKSVSDAPGSGGDIRNACVTFEIGGVTIGPLTPQLINAADLTTGVVVYNWTANIGTADYSTFDLKVKANCYFTGEDQSVITVYKPVGNFITGGGNIKPTLSSGIYASTPGLKANFGFNVKFNKKGTNLQGGMNIIYRQLVGNVTHLFQIKANSMSSLGIDISNPNAKTGVFTSKSNLNNLTTGENLGGNLQLQVKITDRGAPGTNDDIAITLWDGNKLLYSSKWTGVNTAQQLLSGGNLVVQSGFGLKSAEITTEILQLSNSFEFEMYPNPTRGEVILDINGSEIRNSKVVVRSVTGGEVFRKEYKTTEQIKLDLSKQVSGVYLVTLEIDGKFLVKKLILDKK